jgi:lipid A 4'-phosphatase
MRPPPILLKLLAATAILAILFIAFPEIDLRFQAMFYDPEAWRFPLDGHPVALFYDACMRVFAWLLFGSLGLATLVRLCGRTLLGLTWQRLGVIWGTLVIGLGLVGHLLLKNEFGRARPKYIIEFGSSADFSPAWIPVSACDSNCSFISGEAGLGYATIAFALMVPAPWRRLTLAGAIAFGSLIAMARIVTGSHYLSDVIFAGLLMALFATGLHYYLVERDFRLPDKYLVRLEPWGRNIRLKFRRHLAGALSRRSPLPEPTQAPARGTLRQPAMPPCEAAVDRSVRTAGR